MRAYREFIWLSFPICRIKRAKTGGQFDNEQSEIAASFSFLITAISSNKGSWFLVDMFSYKERDGNVFWHIVYAVQEPMQHFGANLVNPFLYTSARKPPIIKGIIQPINQFCSSSTYCVDYVCIDYVCIDYVSPNHW